MKTSPVRAAVAALALATGACGPAEPADSIAAEAPLALFSGAADYCAVPEFDLDGRAKRRHGASVNSRLDRGPHVRISMAQQAGTDATRGHVDQPNAVAHGHVLRGGIREPNQAPLLLGSFHCAY